MLILHQLYYACLILPCKGIGWLNVSKIRSIPLDVRPFLSIQKELFQDGIDRLLLDIFLL